MFLSSCQYIEVQAQLAALLGLHGTNSRISITSIASFAANTNTETAYKQFCKDLHLIGITGYRIRYKEDEILEILKSQGMVASQIVASDTRDEDQVLETAYRQFCEELFQIGVCHGRQFVDIVTLGGTAQYSGQGTAGKAFLD